MDISYQEVGKFEETRYEKIHNEIFENSTLASKIVASTEEKSLLTLSHISLGGDKCCSFILPLICSSKLICSFFSLNVTFFFYVFDGKSRKG